MKKGIIVKKSTDIDPSWITGICIANAPFAYIPQNPTAILVNETSSLPLDTYYYVVTAIGTNGESNISSEVSETTVENSEGITIDWDDQEYIDTYRVYRGTETGVYDGYIEVSESSFTDLGERELNTNQTSPVLNMTSNSTSNKYAYSTAFNLSNAIICSTSVDNIFKIHLKNESIDFWINLSSVLNQPTWYTNGWTIYQQYEGMMQAVRDLTNWATDL